MKNFKNYAVSNFLTSTVRQSLKYTVFVIHTVPEQSIENRHFFSFFKKY